MEHIEERPTVEFARRLKRTVERIGDDVTSWSPGDYLVAIGAPLSPALWRDIVSEAECLGVIVEGYSLRVVDSVGARFGSHDLADGIWKQWVEVGL